MNMPNVFLHSNGSASFVVLRPQTRWALKCSTSPMVLSIQMVSTKRNGSAATNVNTLTTWTVLHMKKTQNSTSTLSAPLMNVENSKRVIKRVIFPFSVAKQKTTKKKRLGKDGRWIGKRQKASAGEGSKEQLWSVADMDEVFHLWEANQNKPPKEKLSKLAISKKTGIPYTTVCERLSGRRGGGRRGKIAGGKRQPKVLTAGKQAGNFNRTSSGYVPACRKPSLYIYM